MDDCRQLPLVSLSMSTLTETRPPSDTDVCPDTHRAPNSSSPVHCPDWCTRVHDDRLWPCCDGVVHSLPLEVHAFDRDQARAVVISLAVFESVETGAEPAGLSIEATADLDDLTPDQLDDYANTLHRAADRARSVLAS